MTYELAKKLKEAGFPQDGKGMWYADNPNGEGDAVYSPTLSELIEACENKLWMLERIDGVAWEAYPYVSVGKGSELGKTPEEAVAKLWLTLKAKYH